MTLMEVIVACAIGSTLLAGAYQITAQGWRDATRAVRRAHENRELAIVRRQWRRLVQPTSADEWQADAGEFRAGSTTLSVRDDGLFEVRGTDAGPGRKWPIPRQSTVRFTTERGPGVVQAAVLTLEWTSRGQRKPRTARFVACSAASATGAR